MRSTVVKRSVVVADHKTSVSLEDEFWRSSKEIAALRNMTLSEFVSEIHKSRTNENLSSAIRLHVLDFYRNGATRVGAPEAMLAPAE
jgi:predicted DNA-binding ribbon-helix-helix protein